MRIRTYLAQVAERVQATMKDSLLTLTFSVELEKDISSTLAHLAEHGGVREKVGFIGSCDLIVISTHGRGGLDSVTDRLLTSKHEIANVDRACSHQKRGKHLRAVSPPFVTL